MNLLRSAPRPLRLRFATERADYLSAPVAAAAAKAARVDKLSAAAAPAPVSVGHDEGEQGSAQQDVAPGEGGDEEEEEEGDGSEEYEEYEEVGCPASPCSC